MLLQGQVDSLTSQAAPGSAEVARLHAEAARLAPAVGTQSVTGPALSVSLNDSKRTAASLPAGYTADDIVVHQQDVQSVVNALWAGGAEAMMLQDQRVISTSAVRCVGNTVVLHGRVYSPPFVVTAVGDPTRLRDALAAEPGVALFRDYVDRFGLGYDVTTRRQITLPAYDGPLELPNVVSPTLR